MAQENVVLQRLDAARKRLIDVSLRNRFLNYRPSKRTGVKIVAPDVSIIFTALVNDNKTARFVEQREHSLLFEEENTSTHGHKANTTEVVFSADDNKQNLEKKLLQIWRDATSIQEEQGINLLFIALGALSWYESDSVEEPRCAPLVFIPVLIEREQGSKFIVRFEGTEVMGNLSLVEMLRQQFNITIRTFDSANRDGEDFDLQEYLAEVRSAVAEQERWRVDEKFAALAFFNFTKYIMYRDLDPDRWSADRSPIHHQAIMALLGETELDSDGILLDDNIDIEVQRTVEQSLEVYDADSSQIAAIMQAKRAPLMIIEGPPGTGKSQTITNLIAEAVYEGQKVLFVAEKRAALDVVWQRLEEAGIASACLELHSSKASKKNFYEQLNNTLRHCPKSYEEKLAELGRLSQLRDKLNAYCHALHSLVPKRGVTPYRCIAEICRLGKEHKSFLGSFRIMKDWDVEDFQRKREIVRQLQNFVKHNGTPSHSPLWGCGLKLVRLDDYEQIQEQIREAITRVEQVLACAETLPSFDAEEIRERIRRNQSLWERYLHDMERVLHQYRRKWFRILIPQYWLQSSRLNRLWEQVVQEDFQIQVLEAAKAVLEAERCLEELFESLQATDALAHLRNASYRKQRHWLEALKQADIEKFQSIARFNQLREDAQKENLQEYAEWAAKSDAAATELVNTLERTWFTGVLSEAFEKYPILRDFAEEHEELIRQFQDLDQMLLHINRLRVAVRHLEGVPRHRGAGNLGILQRELQKSRAHKPIRQIMAEAGEAVLAIKPVFMMSPLSVAMYLPPDGPQFDFVIFDEASQVKPEDAFGAILRAKRVIIVGDSKQLPPTTFFDRLTEDEGDDEDVTTGIESILDLAGSAITERHPLRKRLRWHYRSKHHSLIACSNRLFYEDSLVVAPNPETKSQQLGIVFRYLPDAIYDRGRSRRNVKEAQAVAQAVIQHVNNTPELSLGVVAFSVAQQQAIQDELEALRRSNPNYDVALTEFDKYHEHEPLFVKNLETVQGDERDVIFISVGYGKDENGYLSMNFGPLNKEGGERRLNVLITRARMRCEVFSNIRHSDIRTDELPSAGVAALRTFLHYAETGEMDIPSPTGKEPMSPFEETVINFVKEQGYTVVPQVGSAGFYIDIGVVDPNNPERFVLGIECDGAQYHSSRTARDRDRLRQQVLEQRGWRIHRVWSTSWYRKPEVEKKRLIEAIQAAVDLASRSHSEAKHSQSEATEPLSHVEERPSSEPMLSEPVNSGKTLLLPPYQFASLKKPVALYRQETLSFYGGELMEIIVEVVKVESPIHVEELIRRVRETLGYRRAGRRIREEIESALQIAEHLNKVEIDGDFVWIKPRNRLTARSRVALPPQYKKLEYVHDEEIQEAIMFAVRHYYGIGEDEVCVEVLKLLGFERVTTGMREAIRQQVQLLARKGRVVLKEGTLRLP